MVPTWSCCRSRKPRHTGGPHIQATSNTDRPAEAALLEMLMHLAQGLKEHRNSDPTSSSHKTQVVPGTHTDFWSIVAVIKLPPSTCAPFLWSFLSQTRPGSVLGNSSGLANLTQPNHHSPPLMIQAST